MIKFFTIVLLLLTISSQSQDKTFRIEHIYENENGDFEDLLDFSAIDFHKFHFIGDSIEGKIGSLILKEIKKGKIVKIDTVFKAKKFPYFIDMNKYQFSRLRLLNKNVNGKNRLLLKFNNYSYGLNLVRKGRWDYQFLGLLESNYITPNLNTEFYLFSLCPPYKSSNGWFSSVPTGTTGGDVLKWYNKFDIKHYFVFSMIIKN